MDSQFILIDKVISKEYELKKFEYKGRLIIVQQMKLIWKS